MAVRGRRPGPGGGLARPAPAYLAAPGRPDRRRRPRAAPGRPPRRCSPRSAGCSTSPAPGPGSGSWSPRSSRPRTTATSRPASSTSSVGGPVRRSRAARSGRCRSPGWSPSSRRTVADPETSEPLRDAAAHRLALARVGHRRTASRWSRRPTRPLVGHPRAGACRQRPCAQRRRAGHALGERPGVAPGCPAKWFLEREAGGAAGVQRLPGVRPRGARARRPGRQGRARRPSTS